MGNYRRYWLDSDQICGINCSIKIEIDDTLFKLTDMQDCYTEMKLTKWADLKKHIKENNDLPKEFEESVCFTSYERVGFINAVKNDEFV